MFDVSLVENAAKCAYRYLGMLGDDGGVGAIFGSADELYVTALLAMLYEAGCFEAVLHLAKR